MLRYCDFITKGLRVLPSCIKDHFNCSVQNSAVCMYLYSGQGFYPSGRVKFFCVCVIVVALFVCQDQGSACLPVQSFSWILEIYNLNDISWTGLLISNNHQSILHINWIGYAIWLWKNTFLNVGLFQCLLLSLNNWNNGAVAGEWKNKNGSWCYTKLLP